MNPILEINLKELVQRAVDRGLCSAPRPSPPITDHQILQIRKNMNGLSVRGRPIKPQSTIAAKCSAYRAKSKEYTTLYSREWRIENWVKKGLTMHGTPRLRPYRLRIKKSKAK